MAHRHGSDGKDDSLTRRRFLTVGLGIGAAAGAAASAMACASARSESDAGGDTDRAKGRLRARPQPKPSSPPSAPLTPGEQSLSLGRNGERDGLLYVPRDLPVDKPLPLLLLLHGATMNAASVMRRVGAADLAERFKTLVLTPDSRGGTWDAIRGGDFGPDVTFIDTALDRLFARVPIDPARLAIGGFSDGATYALSLGLINGDLFSHVIAFSPGFVIAEKVYGKPAIFVSHGTSDEILPIDSTSHRIVPNLRRNGYSVQFRVFAGPHTVPADIAQEAFEWMFTPPAASPAAPTR